MNGYTLKKTDKFSVIVPNAIQRNTHIPSHKKVFLDLICEYTSKIVNQTGSASFLSLFFFFSFIIHKSFLVKRRPWCELITKLPSTEESSNDNTPIIQISDFEMIEWEPVLEGKHSASSYIIRKGLSRKAQLAIQIKRFTSKNPNSILKSSIPFSLVVETWNAFEEMKFDFGGGLFASFDSGSGYGGSILQSSLRQRLEWSLAHIQSEIEEETRQDWLWILKPSVTNKGANITVHNNWEGILNSLEECSDVREWVLQR